MEQSKLLELLTVLEEGEKAQLIAFSKLQMFNSGRMKIYVPQLLELCLKSQTASLDKKFVYKSIFPDQDFSEGKLEKVMVDAYKTVKHFLICSNYVDETNDFQKTYDFAKILRNRGLKKQVFAANIKATKNPMRMAL